MTQLTIAHLLREHRQVEREFAPLEAVLQAGGPPPAWTKEISDKFATFATSFAECVIPHIRKEEEILFPALEGFLPRDLGPLAVLRGEHHEMRQHFEQMRLASAALDSGDSSKAALETFWRHVRALAEQMKDHIYKEDRVLFPLVARFLSGVRDAYLLREMESFPTSSLPAKTTH